jgi:hypothetical protein
MLAVLAVMAPQALAVPLVSLSSPDNLTQLEVGDTVRLDVILSGLPDPNTGPNADFLFRVYTEVLFPSTLFDPVSGPTAGPILPLATQQANFFALSSLTDGSALGIFDESRPPDPLGAIGLNGLFYSFNLVATAAGSGTIQFDPADTRYVGSSSNFAFAPLPTGPPLAFTITGGTAVIPEPSTMVLAASGALMGIGSWWRRRSRAAA